MNILHVLSGDFVTGAETSAAALIDRQVQKGHKVHIAAGKFAHPTKASFHSIPIYDRGPFARFRNILSLVRLIRSANIQIVHSHSRAASWVAHWACRWTGTAYLSTLHGRQHLHFSNRYFNIYGPLCAAVCEDIRDQMQGGTKVFKPGRIAVIRNGIELKPGRK